MESFEKDLRSALEEMEREDMERMMDGHSVRPVQESVRIRSVS